MGRRLLERLEVPEPWRGNVTASVRLIDDLERQIAELNRRLRQGHADHPYIPLLLSAPGIGWVLAFTIAAEIGQIERFSSPHKLAGYTGLCPRVNQSGDSDRRGPLTKQPYRSSVSWTNRAPVIDSITPRTGSPCPKTRRASPRHGELLDQLALPRQQADVEPVATQIQSSVQHEDGPP